MAKTDIKTAEHALDHAWNWFALHAGQRMQSFNYFLIASAFLFTAYGSLLKEYPSASIVTALLGVWISFWFHQMERRTRQLVKAGEKALEPLQQELAEATGVQAFAIVRNVEKAEPGAATYFNIIRNIEWAILFAFVVAALYAAHEARLFHC